MCAGDHAPASVAEMPEKKDEQVSAQAVRRSRPQLDRSWGKAVIACAATFFSSAVHSTSGIFYVALMREFGVNRETASWPTSVFQAMDNVSGIILVVLQKHLPVSSIGLIGSVLFWSGILASYFAPDIAWMTVTFGLIQGLGSGVVCVAITVVLMSYFEKYRGVATGIRYAGYSFSSLLYPLLLARLEQSFSFRQNVFLFGGISLHLTPLVLALKEPPWERQSKHAKEPTVKKAAPCRTCQSVSEGREIGSIEHTNPVVTGCLEYSREKVRPIGEPNDADGHRILATRAANVNPNPQLEHDAAVHTQTTVTTSVRKCGTVDPRRAKLVGPNLENTSISARNGLDCATSSKRLSGMEHDSTNCVLFAYRIRPATTNNSIVSRSSDNAEFPIDRPSGVKPREKLERTCCVPVTSQSDKNVVDCEGSQKSYQNEKRSTRFAQLLLKPAYWVVVLGGALADYSDCVLMATLVDSALDRGATRLEADLAIACSAPAQLFGRTVVPLVADMGYTNRTTLACACYFLFAVTIAFLALTHSYATYAPCAAVASLFMGTLTTMKHVVTADYFGVEAVPMAWSTTGVIMLPMLLCNPSILGFFRDQQGSYDNFYHSLSGLYFLMGTAFLLLRCSACRREKNWSVDPEKE